MKLENAVDELHRKFEAEMKKLGYDFQDINPAIKLYDAGARFIYIIPTDLWMHTKKIDLQRSPEKPAVKSNQDNEKTARQTIMITNHPTEKYKQHIDAFYEYSDAVAKRFGKEITATHPTFAADGVMVIYLGIK